MNYIITHLNCISNVFLQVCTLQYIAVHHNTNDRFKPAHKHTNCAGFQMRAHSRWGQSWRCSAYAQFAVRIYSHMSKYLLYTTYAYIQNRTSAAIYTYIWCVYVQIDYIILLTEIYMLLYNKPPLYIHTIYIWPFTPRIYGTRLNSPVLFLLKL